MVLHVGCKNVFPPKEIQRQLLQAVLIAQHRAVVKLITIRKFSNSLLKTRN